MGNRWRGLFGDRYGIDNLNIALIVMALALSLLGRIFPRALVLALLGMLLIALVFFRALSRKIVLRQAENEKFLSLWYRLRDFFDRRGRSGHTYATGSFRADAGKESRRPAPAYPRPGQWRPARRFGLGQGRSDRRPPGRPGSLVFSSKLHLLSGCADRRPPAVSDT